MKTNYFNGCNSLEDVKKLFKILAFQHHPDRKGGNTQKMQEIILEYTFVLKNPNFKDITEEQKQDFVKYPDIISKLINMNGLIIEIIGSWLWISGNTYQYKKELKEIGFLFAPKKIMWYYRPSDFKSSNLKPQPIENIRQKYGSDIVEQDKRKPVLN